MRLLVLSADQALIELLRGTFGQADTRVLDPTEADLARRAAGMKDVDAVVADLAGGAAAFLGEWHAAGGRAAILVVQQAGDRPGPDSADIPLDYLPRPVSAELLAFRLRRLQDAARARRDVRDLRSRLAAQEQSGRFIAESPVTRQSLDRARILAGTEGDVLIVAESGAGKHALAAQIHALGPEREGPMLSLPNGGEPELIESLLFGNGKGAEAGLTRQVAGGSLLLEELSAIPGELLARLAQDRDRNGHAFRLIALTDREPAPEHFGQPAARRLVDELLRREVQLPPVRQRREDIPALLAWFAQQAAQRHGRAVSISPDALALLTVYPWPGNVRELRQAVERAAGVAIGRPLEYADFGLIATHEAAGVSLKAQVEAFERQVIAQVLETASGSRRETARMLGISLRTLFYKIRRYSLDGK